MQQLVGPPFATDVVDCKSVVDGPAHIDRAVKSGNGDHWNEIRDGGAMSALGAKRVKYHAVETDLLRGLEPHDAVSNEVADLFGEKAALSAAVPPSEAGNAVRALSLA